MELEGIAAEFEADLMYYQQVRNHLSHRSYTGTTKHSSALVLGLATSQPYPQAWDAVPGRSLVTTMSNNALPHGSIILSA